MSTKHKKIKIKNLKIMMVTKQGEELRKRKIRKPTLEIELTNQKLKGKS